MLKKNNLYKNVMGSSLTHTASFHQVSLKSVQLILCNLAFKPDKKL